MKKCRICHSEIVLFTEKGKSKIYKCTNCGFGFTEDLNTQTGQYHRDETYIEEEGLFKNIFLKRVKIITNFIKKGRVLEVGCSTGLMLSILKSMGWEALGVEISAKSANIARGRGVEVITKPFEEVEFTGQFDVIIFNHTLEHVADPVLVIKKSAQLLKNKGILYIDLPNFGSFSAQVQKGDWPLLLPNEHLWHFTPPALKKLLARENLEVVFSEMASGIWDLDNPILELLIATTQFKKRFFTELITAIPSLLFTKIGLGSDLMVIARKN
ncbi:MAG: class I SAM-dependent methyltransferase [Candidatus Daviesbacteria bacterium]|nr:class I SAM-dependent methyltransferase [Candidatus Daviesbacteria bacterium]